jgi:Arc/MetJ-type ribon-helix-helix transcriptional regulator
MTIQLTPEQEAIIREALRSGNFHSAEEVISRALNVLRETPKLSDESTRREAVREMQRFCEKNRAVLQDVTVKELIHEGHRL